MGRRGLFDTRRPVLSGAHGGTVRHEPFGEFVSSHLAWEIVLGIILVVLVAFIALTIRASLITQQVASVPDTYTAEYRSYDTVERIRALRLVVSDRTYDTIESLRMGRLAAPLLSSDRSYNAVESVRTGRLVAPLLTGDRTYDAVEGVRTGRAAVPALTGDRSYDAIERIRLNR